MRGVVLPETGGASDKPVSWQLQLVAELVPAPTVEPLRLMQSVGPVAEPLVESTRLSLPSAVLAFPSGCENKTRNCKQIFYIDREKNVGDNDVLNIIILYIITKTIGNDNRY